MPLTPQDIIALVLIFAVFLACLISTAKDINKKES